MSDNGAMVNPRHGLEAFLAVRSSNQAISQKIESGAAECNNIINVEILHDRSHLNLRGNPDEVKFLTQSSKILGQELPLVPNTMTVGEHHIYWLGPNEWLVLSADTRTRKFSSELRGALKELHTSVVDLSGGQIALNIDGPEVRRLLAKGCTLDFHTRQFRPLDCAQSGLAKAIALFGRVDEANGFELVVRRSFQEYLLMWLVHSGREFGVKIQ